MREVGEKSGEGRGGNGGVGKGNARKKFPKNATYLAFGDAFWGLPLRVIHFLSRDAMQARAMSSCGVCPSVTFVHMYSIKRNKDIVKKFSPSGCHTILVFAHQTPWQYSNGDLLTGASNAGGVGKNRASEQTLLRAVNRSTAKCNILSCDGRWTVDDTSLW